MKATAGPVEYQSRNVCENLSSVSKRHETETHKRERTPFLSAQRDSSL